jgi:hypothetical protein
MRHYETLHFGHLERPIRHGVCHYLTIADSWAILRSSLKQFRGINLAPPRRNIGTNHRGSNRAVRDDRQLAENSRRIASRRSQRRQCIRVRRHMSAKYILLSRPQEPSCGLSRKSLAPWLASVDNIDPSEPSVPRWCDPSCAGAELWSHRDLMASLARMNYRHLPPVVGLLGVSSLTIEKSSPS